MEHKTHKAKNGAIHYWISEFAAPNSPALISLPGLTTDHRLFDKQIEHFADGLSWRCVVWDAPSHGLSRPFPLTWSLDGLARMLNNILEQEDIERPVLVGQSLGGYIAQAYMELFPEKTKGFISIDSAPLRREYITAAELFLLKHTHAMYSAFPWKSLKKYGAMVATSSYGKISCAL